MRRWLALALLTLGGCGQATGQVSLQNPGRLASGVGSGVGTDGRELSARHCFADPERCGYPGPENAGVANCASLTPSGSLVVSTAGRRIEGLDITGSLIVAASKVTINHVCVIADGGGVEGSQAIRLEPGADDTTVERSTIRGENESTGSVDEALANDFGGSAERAVDDRIYDCGECIHYAWTVIGSYVLVNGMRNTGDHYEDWYFNNNTITAVDDTMFNSYRQTAVLFGNVNNGAGGACENHVDVTRSFFAGGGAMLYPCGNATSAGTSTMTIKDDRFARMRCSGKEHELGGGWECERGRGEGGYWPLGGFFSVAEYIFAGAHQLWQGNFWDDDLASVRP